MSRLMLPETDLDLIAQHCTSELLSLRNSHVLVTGGSGFFGRWILSALIHARSKLELNLKLTTLTRSRKKFAEQIPDLSNVRDLEILEGDIRQLPELPSRPKFIIHAATDTTAGSSPIEQRELFDSIVHGTEAMLDYAMKAGTEHFLLTSSGGVYGKIPGEIKKVREDFTGSPDPLLSGSAYGTGKRAAEYLAGLFGRSSRMKVTIARGFAFVGPLLPLEAHFAIGNFIRDALAGKDILIKGDGTPVRSYMYAADMVIWLLKIMLHGKSGEAYNLGSDIPVTMKELAELVTHVTNPEGKVIVQGESSITGVGSFYVPDITKARREIHLDVFTPLSQAIQNTAEWHRSRSSQR